MDSWTVDSRTIQTRNTMNRHSYSLQKYAGTQSRHTCPSCGGKRCFTRYIDEEGYYPSIPKSVLLPKSARKVKLAYCIFSQKSVNLYANGNIYLIFH